MLLSVEKHFYIKNKWVQITQFARLYWSVRSNSARSIKLRVRSNSTVDSIGILKPGKERNSCRKKLKSESILMTEKDDIFRLFGCSHTALSSYQAIFENCHFTVQWVWIFQSIVFHGGWGRTGASWAWRKRFISWSDDLNPMFIIYVLKASCYLLVSILVVLSPKDILLTGSSPG